MELKHVIGDEINEIDIKNISISFGYLFTTNNGQNEGLFKIICNDKTFYVALQKASVMLINITEALYISTIEQMEKLRLNVKCWGVNHEKDLHLNIFI